MKKNAIVGQSGGPTAVINASLYGVVYEALNREDVIGTIYGMINGIEGFLNENMMDMKPLEANGELELIKTTPGSYLGSCRYKLPEDLTDAVYPQLFEKFEKYNIGYFFYIGGNDSMDTVSKLSRYMIKLNTNENPYPPAPGVEKALREMDTDTMRLYPDPTMRRSTNGGGENSPKLAGEDDFYELFFASLEEHI